MTVKEKVLSLLLEAEGGSVSGEEIAKSLQVTRSAVWKGIRKLQEEGYSVEGVPNKGYRLLRQSDKLSAAAIQKYLGEQEHPILVYPEVSSTNLILKELAEKKAPEGTIVLAERQTAGRGRRERSFYSPSDTGIYMSLLLRPQMELEDAVLITAAAAAGTAIAIEEVTGRETRIKWVNDIFMDGRKVCGILTEASMSVETGSMDYCILGIGVNVYRPREGFPDSLKSIAASLYTDREKEVRNLLAAEIIRRVTAYYRHLEKREFYQEYRRRSLVIGKKVKIGGICKEEQARVLDLDQRCRLVVELENGKIERLQGGELSILQEE